MNTNKCQIQTHSGKNIISLCFHTNCSGKRVCCHQCQHEYHLDHFDQVIELEVAMNFIKTQIQKPPNDPSPLVKQRLEDLQETLKYIEELSKLINEEVQRLKFSNENDVYHFLGYQYNIKQNDPQTLSNQELSQVAEYIFPIVRINNFQITPQESTDYISNIMNNAINMSIEIEQRLISIQNNFGKPKLLEGHIGQVIKIDICKHRNLLASGSDDKMVKLWNLVNVIFFFFNIKFLQYEVAFSDHKNLLAFGGAGDYSIIIVDFTHLKQVNIIAQLSGYKNNICSLSFSKDSQYLRSWSDDDTFRIWDINTKNETYQQMVKLICALIINDNDSLIALINESGEILIQNLQNQRTICTKLAHDDEGQNMNFSNDQKMLVSCGNDKYVKLWSLAELNHVPNIHDNCEIKVLDPQTGYVVKQFKIKSTNEENEFYVAFSKDMKILAYSEDKHIAVLRQKQ